MKFPLDDAIFNYCRRHGVAVFCGAVILLGIGMHLTVQKVFYGQDIGSRPLLLLGILLIFIGFQFVTILKPASNDVFVSLPPQLERTKSAGFRGTVDISSTQEGQGRLALHQQPDPRRVHQGQGAGGGDGEPVVRRGGKNASRDHV